MFSSKTYIKITKIIFFVVGLGHLTRLIMGWTIFIGGWIVPTWVSIIGVIVAWSLAFNGYKLYGKNNSLNIL